MENNPPAYRYEERIKKLTIELNGFILPVLFPQKTRNITVYRGTKSMEPLICTTALSSDNETLEQAKKRLLGGVRHDRPNINTVLKWAELALQGDGGLFVPTSKNLEVAKSFAGFGEVIAIELPQSCVVDVDDVWGKGKFNNAEEVLIPICIPPRYIKQHIDLD